MYVRQCNVFFAYRFEEGFTSVESNTGETFDFSRIDFTRKTSDEHYQELCLRLGSGDYSAVVDMAWGGWIKGRKTAAALGLPYIRVESANHLFVQAADDFLRSQNATDAALIFEDQVSLRALEKSDEQLTFLLILHLQTKLDQSLYYIIGNSFLRIIGAHQEDSGAFDRLKKMRPRPSNYIAWGSTEGIKKAYRKAKEMQMLKRDTRSVA